MDPAQASLIGMGCRFGLLGIFLFHSKLQCNVTINRMNAEQLQTHNRNFTDSQLGDNVTINQGDVHHHYPSERSQPRKPIRLIPYLRNKEFVDRPDLVEKLNTLLPHVPESFNDAALWGLGGSG